MSIRKLLNRIAFVAVLASAGMVRPGFAQVAAEIGGMDETGPYNVVPNWFKPGIRWHQVVAAVAADKPDRILISTSNADVRGANPLIIGADGVPEAPRRGRGGSEEPAAPMQPSPHAHLILALNADGKVIEDWSQWDSAINVPHNIYVNPYDKQRSVWVVDREGQQILKFSNDGKKLLLKLGEKDVPGTDQAHFNSPAGMTFLPDGSILIADGYRNTRIIKFDANGKFQMEWGTKGSGPGQFNLVHAVAIDNQKRVYVADRSNNRIQVFDEAGKYLREMDNIRSPAFLMISADNKSFWVASNSLDRIAKYDMEGHFQTSWGTPGTFDGAFTDLHYFTVDKTGNLYIADTFNNRVQKFIPKPGADKARLVDQPFISP